MMKFIKITVFNGHGRLTGGANSWPSSPSIGPQATELIAESVVAQGTAQGTIEDLMFTIHAHPTLS